MEAMGVSIKSGCPVGRAGSSPATGTRGRQKRLNMGARWCVLWPTLGRVALWLVPPVGRLVSCVWRLVRGFCCAFCVRFVFAVLFPSFWTVIQHGCWVRLLIGSLELFGWGSIPLLSARVPRVVCWASTPLLWRAGRGLLSFPCLGYVWAALRVVWVGAPLRVCL